VTRDSVCAADDCDAPHNEVVTMPSFLNPSDFIREFMIRYSLPMIFGGKATWTCHLNGEKIAVVAQQWTSPKVTTTEIKFIANNKLHFSYHAQVQPEDFI
jgi:hypothetical protein